MTAVESIQKDVHNFQVWKGVQSLRLPIPMIGFPDMSCLCTVLCVRLMSLMEDILHHLRYVKT